MPSNPSVFNNVYTVAFVDGEYVVTTSSPTGTDVTAKDDINDGNGDVHSQIGDVANDQFDVLSSGALDGSYTFVTVAQNGGASGFMSIGSGSSGIGRRAGLGRELKHVQGRTPAGAGSNPGSRPPQSGQVSSSKTLPLTASSVYPLLPRFSTRRATFLPDRRLR